MYYCPPYDYPSFLRQAIAWLWAVFNVGGPMTRTRKETILSSMLDNENSPLGWPKRLRIGIAFPPGISPREYMNAFLAHRGFAVPDECKQQVELPLGTYFCRSIQCEPGEQIDAETADPAQLLRAAIILGLCNNYTFNAGRPVLWTDGRLTRAVALYEIGGFYGND